MIVSIHQPAYVPWLGYFDKIAKSDVHIFFDDAKYSKNNLFNRNKIKMPQGELWLTIPIKYKSNVFISETKIDNTSDWKKRHWNTIKLNYARAPYFKDYSVILEKFYREDWEYLSDITIAMNKAIVNLFGIKIKFVKSSELKADGSKNEKLINLCKAVGADTYLSGRGAKDINFNPYGKPYLDEDLFLKHNIKVDYQQFNHPVYGQLWGEFIPNLSAIDFLFNCGADKFKEILKNESI
jgi:hypothetical protein